MLTLDKIYHAKFVLKKVARKTDLIAAPRLCPGTDLYLKTENLQVTGSFKVRGADYKIGQLSLVSDIVSACGANVVSVHHDRSDANMAITSCFLKLGLETRDAAQIEQIKQKLTEAGFKLVTERA